MVFNHTFGKTLRDGSSHSFCVPVSRHATVCPVSNFKLYLVFCRFIKVNISYSFLFRSLTQPGATRRNLLSVMRLITTLRDILAIWELMAVKFPHSLHSGWSITLQLLGILKHVITRHIGWRTLTAVDRYNGLHDALLVQSPSSPRGNSLPGKKTQRSKLLAIENLTSFRVFFRYFLQCRFANSVVPNIL